MPFNIYHILLSVVTVAGLACGSSSARDQFELEVVPVLEGNCLSASCHGVSTDSEARGEVINWDYFFVRIENDGRIADIDDAYKTALSRINTLERPEFSSLLQKPLAPGVGGVHHTGGVQFSDRESPSYQTIRDWVLHESGGGEGHDYAELTDLQRQFASEVQPHLVRLQCMNASCHGAFAPFTGFKPPLVIDGDTVFSVDAIQANYKSARMHLDFGGNLDKARLLRKVLPMEGGGIAHRGGNDIFFRNGQEAPMAIYAWAQAERLALMGSKEDPVLQGVVFVRGPIASSPAFEHSRLVLGTDLYVLDLEAGDLEARLRTGSHDVFAPEHNEAALGTLRNLTGSIHGVPADIRDPAVNHDATRIAFAMRRSAQDAHNIYEIGVDGTGLRQLTFDAADLPGGGHMANVQPTYGPDGRIYFVSTRAGILADSHDVVDTDIWSVDPAGGALERFTYTPSPEVTPNFVGTGKNYGSLAFTMRRTINGRYQAAIFRGVLDHNKKYHADPEIHIHHGTTIEEDIVYGMRTMPDGRYSSVLLNRDNQWLGGKLAVFDRQFGAELPRGLEAEASAGGFRHAFSVPDSQVTAGGVSPGGFYRNPVPLPDGTLLTTFAPGPIDLDDPDATPELGLYIVTLAEDRATGEPSVATLASVLDEPGVAEYDAEPIVIRPLEDDPSHEHTWDRNRTTGTGILEFRHVETLEALFANLEQRGTKMLRDDLVYARIIESIPVTPNENLGTPVGATVHGRTRILAEVPLAGGSLHLELPADTPFRVQFLNAERMAVGAQQNRWNHVAPGEKFPGGTAPELYPRLCASCHGSFSGEVGDVGGAMPDMISSASVTLATHENLNPRRPLAPLAVGESPTTIDYARDLEPLVSRSCAVSGCHVDPTPAGALLLTSQVDTFDSAYLALLPYVDATGASAYKSPLIERLFGRELGAAEPLGGSCLGQPALSNDERLLFSRWVDLGAVYRGVAP